MWKSILFVFLFSILSVAQNLKSIEISPILEKPTSGSIDMMSDGETLHVSKKPVLSLKDFTHADVNITEGQVTLNLSLTPSAGERIKSFTSKNVGKRLAFIVNGKLLKAPKVRDPIDGKGISIDPIDRTEADQLADQINSQSP